MQIADKTVVTIAYTLSNDKGEVTDKVDSEQPFAYLQRIP